MDDRRHRHTDPFVSTTNAQHCVLDGIPMRIHAAYRPSVYQDALPGNLCIDVNKSKGLQQHYTFENENGFLNWHVELQREREAASKAKKEKESQKIKPARPAPKLPNTSPAKSQPVIQPPVVSQAILEPQRASPINVLPTKPKPASSAISDLREFENINTDDPFEAVMMNTIDDMAELQSVLANSNKTEPPLASASGTNYLPTSNLNKEPENFTSHHEESIDIMKPKPKPKKPPPPKILHHKKSADTLLEKSPKRASLDLSGTPKPPIAAKPKVPGRPSSVVQGSASFNSAMSDVILEFRQISTGNASENRSPLEKSTPNRSSTVGEAKDRKNPESGLTGVEWPSLDSQSERVLKTPPSNTIAGLTCKKQPVNTPVKTSMIAPSEHQSKDGVAVDSLLAMGFNRLQIDMAMKSIGSDTKQLVDHLCAIQQLTSEEIKWQSAQEALLLFKSDMAKASRYAKAYQQLVEFGFPADRIQTALLNCDMDTEKALNILVS